MFPDDPWFEEVDSLTWIWMYMSWQQDQEEMHKTYKDYALFIGAFSNAKMASDIIRKDNPQFESSEEDFEKSVDFLENENIKLPVRNKKRTIA